ncbi:hypothetical protein [Aurantibacillus circumpalustris]|uniref:hypothetical protein n=1 Tax=Aurantibacillus circumpalustris TaxID=3036359 RepID=UPI00295A8C0A|nr:hypothetical protein [Aurantibacillus circumpalustris]
MKLKRPNKALELQIQQAVKRMVCPIHSKPAKVDMDSENEEVKVEACCVFFKNDVMVVGERMRKDFLYKAEKTRERIERERKRDLGNS